MPSLELISRELIGLPSSIIHEIRIGQAFRVKQEATESE